VAKPTRRTHASERGGTSPASLPSKTPGTCKPADLRKFGWFEDCVHACWLSDGRYMALLKPLTFHQARDAQIWVAPAGTLTDGASIPSIFWAVIGGPFEGEYRDAAVNHDYACCVMQRPWQQVHRMFYDGMRARNVEPWRAKLMYFAVYFFGPRWPQRVARRPQLGFTEDDIARAARVFKTQRAIDLDDIEQLTPTTLRARSPRMPSYIQGSALLEVGKRIRPVTRKKRCTTSACA
jgi:hypothetical protein